jgi:hypothetical protein
MADDHDTQSLAEDESTKNNNSTLSLPSPTIAVGSHDDPTERPSLASHMYGVSSLVPLSSRRLATCPPHSLVRPQSCRHHELTKAWHHTAQSRLDTLAPVATTPRYDSIAEHPRFTGKSK